MVTQRLAESSRRCCRVYFSQHKSRDFSRDCRMGGMGTMGRTATKCQCLCDSDTVTTNSNLWFVNRGGYCLVKLEPRSLNRVGCYGCQTACMSKWYTPQVFFGNLLRNQCEHLHDPYFTSIFHDIIMQNLVTTSLSQLSPLSTTL